MEEAFGFTARFIGYLLFELFLYSTGRLVLPVISGGILRAGPFTGWSWLFGPILTREPDGTRLLNAGLVAAVGFLMWAVIAVALFAIF